MNDLYIKASEEPWVRPADWLPIDNLVNVGDHRFAGLFAVFPDKPNVIAFNSASPYTVDWGDGNVINYPGVTANYQYNFTSIPASTQTAEGFRQVVIQVYFQTTVFTGNFIYNADRTVTPVKYLSQFIDVKVSFPNANTLTAASNWSTYLEKLTILGETVATQLADSRFFSSKLRQLNMSFARFTIMNNMFSLSKNRFKIANLNADSCTSASFFGGTSGLYEIGVLNMPLCTNTSNIFNTGSLEEVGNVNIPLSTTMQNGFQFCLNLKKVGNINAASVTNGILMFASCISLESTGTLTFTAATDLTGMFNRCSLIKTIAITTSAALLNITNFATQCYNLESLTISNCSGVTTTTSMLNDCRNLKTLILTGLRVGFTIPPNQNQMNETAFINLFNSLGTASGAQSIVITGNITLLPSTIAIATGKGFTVVP